MTAWALVFWALAAAGGLQVETSTPDALCPDLGQVREAAHARLGDIEAEGAWRASYALIHRPDRQEAGDIVRLELHDPGGHLRLRRDLPRAGESCAALARALVVVLDGYFRHPTDARAPAGAGASSESTTTLSAAPRERSPASSPALSRLALDLAGGWSSGWAGADQSSPLLALALRVAVLPPAWWAGVEGSWLWARRAQTLGGATATQRSYAMRAFLSRDLLSGGSGGGGGGGGRVALLAGPEAVLALDRADGAMLLEGAARTRASFGGGARAQLQISLARRLCLDVLAAFDYFPSAWGGSFWVVGMPAQTEIFPASRARLTAGMGLSWAVF